MKKIKLFLLLVFSTCYAVSFSFTNKKRIEKEILSYPEVAAVCKMVSQNDWNDIYDVYIKMRDGTKIVFWQVQYKNKMIKFGKFMRIGEFTPNCYKYDIKEKVFCSIDYLYYFPPLHAPILSQALSSREVKFFLENYKSIQSTINTFTLISPDFYEKKVSDSLVAFDMVKDSLTYTNDNRFYYGFFNVQSDDKILAVKWYEN